MTLLLSREDYFPAPNLPVAVAERMPQPSFPLIGMSSVKLSLFGEAMACMS